MMCPNSCAVSLIAFLAGSQKAKRASGRSAGASAKTQNAGTKTPKTEARHEKETRVANAAASTDTIVEIRAMSKTMFSIGGVFASASGASFAVRAARSATSSACERGARVACGSNGGGGGGGGDGDGEATVAPSVSVSVGVAGSGSGAGSTDFGSVGSDILLGLICMSRSKRIIIVAVWAVA